MSPKTKRLAVVNTDNCVARGTCYALCPFGVMEIYQGCYARPDATKCIGCGTCARS